MPDPSARSGSALSAAGGADRRSRTAASILALVGGASAWLSAGSVGFTGGDADRVAALPPVFLLLLAIAAAVAAVSAARLRLNEVWPLAISLLIWLPFLPGGIPAAFMLWEGPLEPLIWAVVVAGLVHARARTDRVRGPWTAIAVDPQRAPWMAAALAGAISLFAFTQVRAAVPSGDEPHYLVATQSLLADRDLKVENNYATGDYLEYFGGRLQPHFLQRSAAGEIYSIHSPGVSVVILPAFALAGYAGAVLTVILIAGLTARLTWITAWRVSGSTAGAWIGVAGVFATAPFLFHTFTIYPDGMGALVVMAGVWLIVRLDESGEVSTRRLAGIGAALAMLPWLHTRFALLAAVIAVTVLARLLSRPAGVTRSAAFLAVPLLAAIAWFAYFWLIWGTPSPLAPYGKDAESSLSYIARGLGGLLIDQQHGVITTGPIYAIAIAGVWPLLRFRPRLALELMAIVVPYVIAVSTYAMWWGGTSAPARFVAALLPLAALPIAYAWARVSWLRVPTVLLLIVAAALVTPRVIVEDGRLVFNSRNLFDPTIEWLSRHVDLAMALPSAHRDPINIALVDGAPWLTAIIVLAGAAYAAQRVRVDRAVAWTIVATSGALVAMGAASTVWRLHGSQTVTVERSTLAALERVRPWHTLAFDARRFRVFPFEEFVGRFEIQIPAAGGAALARLRRVPAGDYEIVTTAAPPEGKVAVLVGRNDPPIESGPTSAPLKLRLPVPLMSLSVRADTTVPDGGLAMRIKPVRIWPDPAGSRPAVRATRYGSARVFFFDEQAYLETRGFWTRAEGEAFVFVDADETSQRTGRTIAFSAGAAATTIGLATQGASRSYSLSPGESRTFVLPQSSERGWGLLIHSGPGFRPFEREPGSIDVRSLAAWFEIP